MEKFKEKIKQKEIYKIGSKISATENQKSVKVGLDITLNIIDQELQDYTFIRVPKKIGIRKILGEIKSKLDLFREMVSYSHSRKSIVYDVEKEDGLYSYDIMKIKNSKLVPLQLEFFIKHREFLKYVVEGTEIEVDL